ncbi:hypothetical protein G6F46_007036 [Rhizopus delemar]|uniref:Ribosomal eL28/Mak16 domain-containing protein n=2 Tax=Rhizopus TaxID=4842 RepID=A0A9P6YQK1_9FUNG|nr:hypothetical protein G6F55_012511 [Rhizopus delemar]KAG1533069.1 hypothetical protein G6F51_012802 [Rhizopus arrhizus]KAG1487593.1 hypothetical protein G6F54_012564 [Rhizopus delemar]KAG1503875.1 hypothetical protein G6F53_010528 [Rhizopus delemar]KAG1505437.1 hypothetical protein G6F52_012086 [Rhizopus delemar]
MSADLVWAIVKNNNSFLVKRQNVQFSSEPSNLLNLNSFKYSGLANYKVITKQNWTLTNSDIMIERCHHPCCSWCPCHFAQG